MQVEVDQEVYVPDPDGKPVRATVLAFGKPSDAVEIVIEGKLVKRDVAIVRHEEGERSGFTARVPYDLITAKPDA